VAKNKVLAPPIGHFPHYFENVCLNLVKIYMVICAVYIDKVELFVING
jgi:uncharacterized membrane protein YhdT